jgi:uncharacterized protein (TIGR02246 family)
MKLRSLGLIAMLVTSPAYADEAMTVAQDVASKWQTAYNNGDAGKIADLYTQDAVWVRATGIAKGKAEIETAAANLMKQLPNNKLTANVVGAGQSGNVVWFYTDTMFANGPTGHSGVMLVNDAGSWHIAMHTTSIAPPKQ